MVTTLTPSWLSSGPIERVNPTKACLVVQYIVAPKFPWYLAIEDIIRTTPFLFREIRARIAIRVSFSGWFTLIWTEP
jgi:hypothetical protein